VNQATGLNAIPSIPNLRDVGGLRTRTGGHLRTGLLYRAAGLHTLDPGDVPAFDRLGIRTVYDLRLRREQAEAPDRLEATTRYVPADVLAGWTRGGPSQLFEWVSDPAAAHAGLADGRAEALWVEQYRAFVRLPAARAAYGAMLRDLAAEASRPALVHCTTGKDRTGWAAALMQLLLDVPDDAVMEHYLRSRDHLAPFVAIVLEGLAARGVDPELFVPVFDVRPAYLEAAIDELRAGYGTVAAYVADGLGVDGTVQRALQEAFVA
jgi:protein-tyrosine phosphatase